MLNLTYASNCKIAAIKLFGEHSIGIAQAAVKVYLKMKAGVRVGRLII